MKIGIYSKQTVYLFMQEAILSAETPKLLNGYLKSIVNSHKIILSMTERIHAKFC